MPNIVYLFASTLTFSNKHGACKFRPKSLADLFGKVQDGRKLKSETEINDHQNGAKHHFLAYFKCRLCAVLGHGELLRYANL